MGAGAAAAGLLSRVSPAEGAAAAARPNIIVILADDLGFECVGAYGGRTYKGMGPVKTPNLDALAAGGMRFERCFATPVCSPTRAEMLTGKYSFRSGFSDIAGRNGAVSSLDPVKHPTLPLALKSAGYVTAVCGKWHLGPCGKQITAKPEAGTNWPHVRACGFDHQYVFGGAHLEDYGQPLPGQYTPDWFHQWAMTFLDGRKGKAEPFFLYYASPIPHFPLKPTPLNPDAPAKDKGLFPTLVQYLDQQVGQIVKKLEELGMRQNTLIVFSGDNGTDKVTTEMADGKVVAGGKAGMKDTGSWVPLIANWPGAVAAGKVASGLVDFSDFMPTCLELIGAHGPANMDGVSFAPQLLSTPGPSRQWVYVHYVNRFFAHDAKYKLRENGQLFDVSRSPQAEALIAKPQGEAAEAKERLAAVLKRLGSHAATRPSPTTAPAPDNPV